MTVHAPASAQQQGVTAAHSLLEYSHGSVCGASLQLFIL